MNPHDSIKSNRPGKHAAAKRDGRHQQATAETRPMAIDRPAHTPGPWRLRADQYPWVSDAEGRAVTSNVTEANARLIAAAPEMLEAMEAAVRWAADVPHPYREFPFMVSIRAAIAKATGGGQ